ncbi:MAG: IclR family transcriptional regulator [Succinivibrio sp.]
MNSTSNQARVKLVKSVVRTIDLMKLFVDASRYLSLQDICDLMKIPKSSAFELVHTMVVKGMVEPKGEGGKLYGLSIMAFEIGSSVVERIGVTDAARPFLQELNRPSGGTVFLGIEDHGMVVYLDKAEDHSVVKATAKLGSRRYLHTTSLGKAILYTHSNGEVLELLGPEPYPVNTPMSMTTGVEVLKDAAISRSRGFTMDNREDGPNMMCFGCAIRDHTGKAAAAISVASIYSLMNPRKEEIISRQVMDTAMEISRKLGYKGDRIYELQGS